MSFSPGQVAHTPNTWHVNRIQFITCQNVCRSPKGQLLAFLTLPLIAQSFSSTNSIFKSIKNQFKSFFPFHFFVVEKFKEERLNLVTESSCTEPVEQLVWQPVNWLKRTVNHEPLL